MLLNEPRFDFCLPEDKNFITRFTECINNFGYDFNGKIGSGYCWGRYMIIYSQTGVKSKKVIARIYIRDNETIIHGGKEFNFTNSIVLRLFFSNIDKHSSYIENAPSYIKEPFTNQHGICNHCKEVCSFRKTYTLGGKKIEKCSGVAFEFHNPKIEYLEDYINLLKEFYGKGNRG